MSSIYVLEPPTKGKVILKTTAGPLDFELWPKEAPKAVRNFIQLCLDGYYDGTTFHRIIKTFMVQGGDPTGTGTGGDTIYGAPFGDEFHSRLRFNHRGLLGCANAGSPNTNNSQFFMTLDRCDWLDRKHTIFGKVTGDSVYNLLKLGEVETSSDDRPSHPQKIISVEVLWNPFDDIIPRQVAQRFKIESDENASNKQRKAKKQYVNFGFHGSRELNLLSFGEEAEVEEHELAAVKEKKIRSSHDVLEDPRLLRSATNDSEMDPMETQRRKDVKASVRSALSGTARDASELKESGSLSPGSDEDGADFDRRMREQIIDKKRMHVKTTLFPRRDSKPEKVYTGQNKEFPIARAVRKERNEDQDDDDEGNLAAKKEKLNIKKKGLGSEAQSDLASSADTDMQLLSPLEQQRLKYKQRKKTLQGRSENTLGRLNRFTELLATSKTGCSSLGQEPQDKSKEDADWLVHSLKFAEDAAKRDDMDRNDDPNQYVVHDPLLEKGKEKFNKMQAKMKRRQRDWAGTSVT